MATMSTTTTIPATMTFSSSKVQNRQSKFVYNVGMKSYVGGVNAQNSVTRLGVPVSTEQGFGNGVNKLRMFNKSGGGRGDRTVTYNAAAEIFKIAAIMNGLTLVGVAVGFVLLRIEASVEESK